MAKFLFFSDLHLHNFSQFVETTPSGLNSRFESQLDVLGQLRQICLDRKVDALFFLGDAFHSRVKIDVDVGFWGHAAFMNLSEAVKEFHVLSGNHDQASRDGATHSLLPFHHFATLHTEPTVDLEDICGVKVAVHPFTEDTASFIEWCKKVDKLEPDLCLFHQGLDGATVGAYEITLKAEIPVAALPASPKFCLGGHYHKHQWVTPRVAYIGSPMQLDFGERNEEKGFLLLDTDTWTTEFIPSEAPRFYLFDTQHLDSDVKKFAKDVLARKINTAKDYIRVTARKRADVEEITRMFPRVQAIYYEEKRVTGPARVTLEEISSDRTLLEAYISKRLQFVSGTDMDGLDPKTLAAIGLEMLGEE